MTTGRIDYSPYYKSETPPAVDYMTLRTEITVRCPECGNSDCEHANALAARAAEQYREQTRLERAVVAAARAWRERNTPQWGTETIRRAAVLESAIDALLEFEAKQNQRDIDRG